MTFGIVRTVVVGVAPVFDLSERAVLVQAQGNASCPGDNDGARFALVRSEESGISIGDNFQRADVGQALLESSVYHRGNGQLVTGSYNDYAMPRADHMPPLKIETIETLCAHNPLGVKCCGEAGAIAAPPAVINAITQAIGVRHIDMPATPEKVWRAIRQQEQQAAEQGSPPNA